MRSEMENLGSGPAKSAGKTVSSDYVEQLEAEVRELKMKEDCTSKLKKLEVLADSEVKDVAGDNVVIRSHFEALHETIGQLRSEKVGGLANHLFPVCFIHMYLTNYHLNAPSICYCTQCHRSHTQCVSLVYCQLVLFGTQYI